MFGFIWAGDAFALRVAATLLHFVWQGLILAFVVLAASVLLRRASARARYSVNVVTMLAMAACLLSTFAMLGGAVGNSIRSSVTHAVAPTNTQTTTDVLIVNERSEIEDRRGLNTQLEPPADLQDESARQASVAVERTIGTPLVTDLAVSTSETQLLADFIGTLTALAPLLTWSYFLGVLFMTVRLTVGLRGGQSLRHDSILVDDAGLLAMVREQAARVGLRCAPAIAYCEQISIPIVIGIVRPMILLPATLVSGLSPDQLQALITHELSHIRRYDLIVNLLQRMIEAVLFFHPAVWFVSRRISMERENVADDAVVAAGWPPIRYADALVRMAELSSKVRTSNVAIQVAALAASGNSSSEFKRRVVRLLDGSSSSQLRLSRGGSLAMLLVTVLLMAAPLLVQLSANDSPVESLNESTDQASAVEPTDNVDAESVTPAAESNESDQDSGPPRIVDGFVTGPSGAIAGVKVRVLLAIDDADDDGFAFSPGKPARALSYMTDEHGRYRIQIPGKFATDPRARVTVKLAHPDYLDRQIGPLAVTDFDGQRLGNDQPAWMSRQMARQAIKQSRLRKANQLTGRILLPDGTPAVGAKVKTATKYRAYSWKFHSPDDYGASDKAVTDREGKFSIEIDESASFTAMMPGQAPLIIDDLTKRIRLANGDSENDFRLPVANRIKGRVVTDDGKPVPRAIIKARRDVKWNEFDMPLSFDISCAADELGYYELPPLPADKYGLSIGGQLSSASSSVDYNKFISEFRSGESPKFETLPLDLVFVPQSVTLEPFTPSTTIDLRAAQMVILKVNVEFPDGAPEKDRKPDVGISGTFNGKEWNGQYATADEDGIATLRAPKGVEWAFIKTGLARHRRSENSEVEIGQAIHFKKLEEDVSGITVIKPAFARLCVEVDRSGNSDSIAGRLSISASYVRKGFREQSSNRQSVDLTGAMQSGQTNYQATALPNEPILLTVSVFNDGERTTLYKEQLTLAPGEERVRQINLRNGKLAANDGTVEAARNRAIEFLLKQQGTDGSWAGSTDGSGYAAGTTALVAMALFDGGTKTDNAVQNATQYLLNASPTMTKEVALQTIFLHMLGKPHAAQRRQNLQWLVDAQVDAGPGSGAWGYRQVALGLQADGANTAYAILALTTVASREATNPDEIPDEVWQRSLTGLLSMQHDDGSWGYTTRGSQSSGAMTACGVAGLKSLKVRVEPNPKVDQAIKKGEAWLATNWSADSNPGSSAWPLFYFAWLCRSLHDTPQLGERDWYPEVLTTVLNSQRNDGSIALKTSTVSPTISTAFALEILRSRPVEQSLR